MTVPDHPPTCDCPACDAMWAALSMTEEDDDRIWDEEHPWGACACCGQPLTQAEAIDLSGFCERCLFAECEGAETDA
jgi:hypothetical protein